MTQYINQSKPVHILTKVCTVIILLLIFQIPTPAAKEFFQKDAQLYIPDALISLSSGHAIVVDKMTQKLFAFRYSKGGFRLVYESRCSTGKNNGTKMVSGDAKTPEGIYFATKAYNDDELSSIYGIVAFRLDYPNFIDRKQGCDGNNIWLHGTNKPLQAFQTNGCVTLTNKDINNISKYIKLHETPIIIQDYTKWIPQDVRFSLKKKLENFLDQWTKSVVRGDSTMLESLYEDGSAIENTSLHNLVLKINKWKASGAKVSLRPSDISILKHDNCDVITFDQILSVDDRTLSGYHRKLFLKKDRANWRIIGDMLQSPATEKQFIAKMQAWDDSIKNDLVIKQLIEDWSKTWESGDIKKYSSFYAPDFRAPGMNLKKWISYKTKVSHLNKDIQIRIENVKISSGKKIMITTFKQKYTSSMHRDVGIKKLYFRKSHGQWKIYRESWKAIKP